MQVWAGAIALGVWMGLPAGAIAVEPRDAPENLEIAQIPTSREEKRQAALRWLRQGAQEVLTSRFQDALQSLGTALALYREIGDQDAEGSMLRLIGGIHRRQGQYPQALESLQQALAISREVGDHKGENIALYNIGAVYESQGQYPQALDYYQQSLAINREVGDRKGEGIALNNIGEIHRSQGQYPQALDYYQQSLAISREVGDHKGEGVILNNIGKIYQSQGQYPQALESFQQALAINREVGDRKGEGATLNNIGAIYQSQGQYPQALDYYQQSLAILRAVGDRRGEGTILNNIGEIYQSQGQYPQALDYYQQSLAINREMGDRAGEGSTLNNIGAIYWRQSQYSQALNYYQQSLSISRAVGDRPTEGTNLNNIGVIYKRQGQYPQALEYYQQSLAINREMGDRDGEGITLTNVGAVYYAQGQYSEATEYFNQSIAILSAIEQDLSANDEARIAFFETRFSAYPFLEASLIAQNKTATALEIADRSRARSLVQFLNPSASNQPPTPLNIDQIKQLAKTNNATLITYSINSPDLYIWVVSPNGQLNFAQADPEAAGIPFQEITGNIRRSATDPFDFSGFFEQDQFRLDLQALRGGNGPTWNGTPQDLKQAYTLLIKPIESLLPTEPGDRLIIVPHRELGSIPFVALIDERDRFLLDRYSITVTPSLQTLATVQTKTGPFTGKPLIVGNPSPMPRANSGDIFDPLPGTETEAQAIAQLLNATPILGRQATKAAIQQQLESASILHFATHGEIANSDRDINGNWLALSAIGSDPNNHKLTLTDIFNSNLNAQLAVLSACNTNSGEATGEGVLGLARAFLKAGVPTVVASLWQVPDDKTQILMEAFYQELLAGKTYADALRLAQLKVRAQSPLPRDWAAFVVIGDGDRTLIQNR